MIFRGGLELEDFRWWNVVDLIFAMRFAMGFNGCSVFGDGFHDVWLSFQLGFLGF